MNKRVLALLAIFAAGACAGARAASTELRAVRALTNEQAMKRLPVEFEATVTYYRNYDIDLFVQDGDNPQDGGNAIYVYYRAGAPLLPGDRVVVRGKTQDSFRPIVVADDVTVLHHGAVPSPILVTAADLFSAQRDSMLGTVRGTVRSAHMVWSAGRRNIYMKVLIDGGYIDAAVNSEDAGAVNRLLDSEIQMTGIITSEFDQKMQQSGARFDVQSLGDIRILKPAATRPQDLPVTPMQDVLGGYHIEDFSKRVQVKGTITFYQPRRAVVLQSGSQSLWIVTQTDAPLRIGDVAYASGFPNVRNGYLTLDFAEVRDISQWAPIAPRPLAWDQIGFAEFAFMLVSAEGELVSEAREAAQDEYVLTSHGHLFSAVYRHPRGMNAAELPPMKHIVPGSRVRVSGINMFYSSDPFDGPVESNLLLRGFDDIAVLEPPSMLNTRNLEIVIGVLFLAILGFAARGWLLERRMRRHTVSLAERTELEAEIERRRSRILEKVNGTGPLDEILEMIADAVSFRLGHIPCWCETRDGARFGVYRLEGTDANVASEEVRAGSGASLGCLFAVLPPGTRPGQLERHTLAKGASMASLAIETRRLYADLVRRSEFDNLTEAHSRYFLERELDILIQLAQVSGSTFGLIYFDLDGFKNVNDSYGHRVGDEYLQQVARRIKAQLRSQDKLARLGGDEFAVLVPLVRSRSDLEEIISRLKASLREPIDVEGRTLRSSASFGLAIYPQDGITRDELIDIADAAMYSSKSDKR
jgi:diguanylate cyclase (GGDEF)-like protein